MTRGFRFDATKVDLATAREKQNELNELKSAWMLRRVKANTIGDNLPRKTDQIVFCSLSPFQVRGFFNYLRNKLKKYLRAVEMRPMLQFGWTKSVSEKKEG